MSKLVSYSFIFIIVFAIILSFLGSSELNYTEYGIDENAILTNESGFIWPIPNFYTISSYFGPRKSPTVSASSYHKGIDIPAKENTYFLASISANVIYADFKGSGGYTIILENGNIQVIYCHVSPNFLVHIRKFRESGTSYWTSSDLTMFLI